MRYCQHPAWRTRHTTSPSGLASRSHSLKQAPLVLPSSTHLRVPAAPPGLQQPIKPTDASSQAIRTTPRHTRYLGRLPYANKSTRDSVASGPRAVAHANIQDMENHVTRDADVVITRFVHLDRDTWTEHRAGIAAPKAERQKMAGMAATLLLLALETYGRWDKRRRRRCGERNTTTGASQSSTPRGSTFGRTRRLTQSENPQMVEGEGGQPPSITRRCLAPAWRTLAPWRHPTRRQKPRWMSCRMAIEN